MPVILTADNWDRWLEADVDGAGIAATFGGGAVDGGGVGWTIKQRGDVIGYIWVTRRCAAA